MRPRVFPAEDTEADADRAKWFKASMRPRVFPAEDQSSSEVVPAATVLQ